MTALGLCVNAKDLVPSRAELAALGIGAGDVLRTPVQGSLSLIDDMLANLPPDILLAIALNNECAEVGSDWAGWEYACQLLATKARSNPGRIWIVGCGNELDLWHLDPPVGKSDPRLTPDFAAELVIRASPILHAAGVAVAMSSVASGAWPAYLNRMAAICAHAADYADLHLYVKRVNGIPGNPDWQDANDAIFQAGNLSGLPVICTEAGIKIDDAGGMENQSTWADGLPGLSYADLVCYFAWSDGVGTAAEQGGQAFGALSPSGKRKPVWYSLQRSFGGPGAVVPVPPIEPPAEFVLGFRDWHSAEPDLIGDPLKRERGGVPGFSVQRTTRGRLMAQYLADPVTNGITGWALTFWEDSTDNRYLWDGHHSRIIA